MDEEGQREICRSEGAGYCLSEWKMVFNEDHVATNDKFEVDIGGAAPYQWPNKLLVECWAARSGFGNLGSGSMKAWFGVSVWA
ncbi:hypothetical protein LIER_27900 [Lithospermum erythrorhizon]|uniref:Uncharacterized protein n=1 Tax=Lithospermum erythrorhizon TaxID=34254 RepID=A0AAV3RDM8_LITER